MYHTLTKKFEQFERPAVTMPKKLTQEFWQRTGRNWWRKSSFMTRKESDYSSFFVCRLATALIVCMHFIFTIIFGWGSINRTWWRQHDAVALKCSKEPNSPLKIGQYTWILVHLFRKLIAYCGNTADRDLCQYAHFKWELGQFSSHRFSAGSINWMQIFIDINIKMWRLHKNRVIVFPPFHWYEKTVWEKINWSNKINSIFC